MLKIDDVEELRVLDRALLDFRLRPDPPNDSDLSADAVLARLHRRVVDARINCEADATKRLKLMEHRKWSDDDFYRPCVERLIRECEHWTVIPPEHRASLVQDFLSPFEATAAQLDALVTYGDDFHTDDLS